MKLGVFIFVSFTGAEGRWGVLKFFFPLIIIFEVALKVYQGLCSE